jgi:hypothetical protein
MKKTLAIGIIFLFLFSVLAPMSNGLNVNNKDTNQVNILDIQPGVSWIKTLGLPIDNDEIYSVRQTNDEGFIMTGMSRSYSQDHYEDAWLVKTDKYGKEIWSKTFGESGPTTIDEGHSVQQTSDGGYVFFGNTMSFGASFIDAWLVKTDKNGDEEWNKTYGGYDTEHGYSVYQTSDGGYIAAGEDGGDVMLVKVDLFENQAPSPPTITGPKRGLPYLPLTYTAVSSDPDGDLLSYFFDWDYHTVGWVPDYTRWTEPFWTSASRSHYWRDNGIYHIRVKAMDEHYAQSGWTTFEVNLPRTRALYNLDWFNLLDRLPLFKEIFSWLIKE